MLNIGTTIGKNKVDFAKDNDNYLLLTVTGKEIETKDKRPPISIVALLDVSSSMRPDYKIGYLKKSVVKLIDNLAVTDRLSLISYSTYAKTLTTLSEMTPENKKKAIDIVTKLQVESMTNISDAMAMGFNEFKDKITSEGVNRIILFTDGCPTSGNTQPEFLVNLATKSPEGVQVTTMGYGKQSENMSSNGMGGELNVTLLEQMADKGKGNYYYMSDPDSCGKAFASELAGLLTVVAQKVKITITPEKDRMQLKEVLDDVDVTDEDGKVTITIPDVMAGETKYVLLSIKTSKQEKPWARPASLATVTTEYTNLIEGVVATSESIVKIEFVKKDFDTELHPEVKTQLAVIEAIKAQERAFTKAAHGDYLGAQEDIYLACASLGDAGTERGLAYSLGMNTTATYCANASSFTSSHNIRSASLNSMKKMRASGGVYDDVVSSKTQKDFQKAWKDADDISLGQTVGTTSTTGGTISVNNPSVLPNGVTVNVNVDTSVGLTKKSSGNRW